MNIYNMWQIPVLIILLGCSAFFSASETALMSLSKIRVRHMMEERIEKAETIHKLIENPNRLLGTILVGNNIVNIGASAIATSLFVGLFPKSGVGIATLVMTVLVLIFGEITPKSLAAQNSEGVSLRISGVISFMVMLLTPIVIVLTHFTSGLIRVFGGKIDKVQPFITEDELKTMVTVSHEEGVLEVEEKQMIHNVFEFGDLQVRDVMVQRTDIVAIDSDTTYEELTEIIKSEQFSRYPVYREQIDDTIGILNVRDLIFLDNTQGNFQVEQLMREPFYTFEFKRITEVFKEMKRSRTHMAIVLDEYGGTAGIVTIEDLIEEIVGEIQDEYDEHEENQIQVVREDEYIVDGSTKIELVNEMIGIHIESEDFDSIGGFIIGELGRLPEMGEIVEYNHIKFISEDIDRNRIRKVRILT